MNKTFLVFDPEGDLFAPFDTLEEAQACAVSLIDDCNDDGWIYPRDEMANLVIAQVLERCTCVKIKHRRDCTIDPETAEDQDGDDWFDADADMMVWYEMKPEGTPHAEGSEDA